MKPARPNKAPRVAAFIILLVAIVVGAFSIMGANRPLVNVREARAATRPVQVRGFLIPSSLYYDPRSSQLQFTIKDENGDELPIRYSGVKPNAIEQAETIGAIGSVKGDVFVAETILTKCPSKYESDKPADLKAGMQARQ
jgi:cytochrome c-type biogenesis protein CcmE